MEVVTDVPCTNLVYYPNHLIHGFLARHCIVVRDLENETTAIKVKVHDQVRFPENILLHELLNVPGSIRFDLNSYISEWKVESILNEGESGYFGVIYVNPKSKQLVLAHGSTDFKISLTEAPLRQSGLHQDIEGVVLGRILLHQGHGFVATEKAVGLIRKTIYSDYTLSFTGHSLGGWLAELSVFYCHHTFKSEYVRAVTFDSPGSRPMMEKLQEGDIDTKSINLEHLDIVCYVSAPNIVNCTNKHVTKLYRIYLDNLKSQLMQHLPSWCHDNEIVSYFLNNNAVLRTGGHFLDCILSCFDPVTGKPRKYEHVDKWPCIKSDCPTNFQFNRATGIFKLPFPAGMSIVADGLQITAGEICKRFKFNDSTLSSVCHLAWKLWQGEIQCEQFFRVQSYLDAENGMLAVANSSIDKFFLKYEAQYQVSDVKPWSKKDTGSKVDECMKKLSQNLKNIQGKQLIDIIKLYYRSVDGYFEIREEFREINTIDEVVDYISKLLYRDNTFRSYVENISVKRIKPNYKNNSGMSLDISAISNFGLKWKVIVLKGIPLNYMSDLVKQYAERFKQEFTTVELNGRTESDFENGIQVVANGLPSNQNFGHYENIYYHLLATKQKVCFFVESLEQKSIITDCIANFYKEDLPDVRFIITTKHDDLDIDSDQKEIFVDIPIEIERQEREKIKFSLNNLLQAQIPVFSNPSVKQGIVNSLAFLKSGKISVNEIVNCLSGGPMEKEDVHHFLNSLRSESYVMVDRFGLLQIHPIVKSLAQELFDCRCPASFLQLVFSFGHNLVETEYLLSKLIEFDHQQLVNFDIEHFKSNLHLRSKCNIKSIVKSFLMNINQSVMEGAAKIKVWINILNGLQEFVDNDLQLQMTNLANGWAAAAKISDNGSRQMEFLNENKMCINAFIEMFNSFGKSMKVSFVEKETFPPDCEHVFLFGPTGGGKSTIINLLIGNGLVCISVDDLVLMTCELVPILVNGNKIAPIGNREDSQTNTITAYFNKEEKVVYWDFPGLFDTHGEIQRIENAFGLQHFSQVVSTAKIVLVVGISLFSSVRGDPFKSTMEFFGNLCNPDNLNSNFSLLVSKCNPMSTEEQKQRGKQQIIRTCRSLLSDSPFLNIFQQEMFVNKLALFSRVDREGPVDFNMCEDIKSVLQSLEASPISFSMNVDNTTSTKISDIADLLNSYADNIFQTAADNRRAEIHSAMRQANFTKSSLETIKIFLLSTENVNDFVAQFSNAGNENIVVVLHNIIEVLNCFHHIVFTVRPEFANWVRPLAQFNEQYDYLFRKATQGSNKNGLVRIDAPILCASELPDKNCLSGVKIIEAVSQIFIFDKDVKLPGITLCLSCKDLRDIGDRKVILKADKNSENKNSGSFYGYTENYDGKISFDLNGLDGDNGKFVSSQRLTDLENALKDDILTLTNMNSCIDEIKKHYKENILAERLIRYEGEEQEYQNRLEEIETEIFRLKREITNKHKLDEAINKCTSEKEQVQKDLQNVQQELKLVRELQQLAGIYNEYEKVSKGGNLEDDKTGLESSCKALADELRSMDCTLNKGASIVVENENFDKQAYKQARDVLIIVEGIFQKLKDFETNQGKKNSTAKNKILEPHSVTMIGFTFNLTALDYHEILSGKVSNIEKYSKEKLIELRKNYTTINEQVSNLKKKLKNFEKQQRNQKESKLQRDKALNAAWVKYTNINIEVGTEFNAIRDKIKIITNASDRMVEANKRWLSVMAAGDIIFPPNKKTIIAISREFLGDVEESAFNKHLEIQKQKLKAKREGVKTIPLLAKFMEMHAKLKLEEAKKTCNNIIKKHELENIGELQLLSNEIEIKQIYDKVCKELTSTESYYSFLKRLFWDIKDALYAFVENQYALHEELEDKQTIIKDVPPNISQALESVKKAKKDYQMAKKNFLDWEKAEGSSQTENVKEYIQAYKYFLECDQKYEDSFKQGVKEASEMLLNKLNLTAQKDRCMDDRDGTSKFCNAARAVFTLNKQLYEKYEISGSDGTVGGNSGAYSFTVGKNKLKDIEKQVGNGGEHAFVLEGLYENEYCFAQFRNLGVKGANCDVSKFYYDPSHIAKLIPSLTLLLGDDVLLMLFTQSVTKGVLGLLSFVPTIVGMATSPLISQFNCGWINGPSITHPGTAPKGKTSEVDVNLEVKCKNNCTDYIKGLPPQMLPFFQHD